MDPGVMHRLTSEIDILKQRTASKGGGRGPRRRGIASNRGLIVSFKSLYFF